MADYNNNTHPCWLCAICVCHYGTRKYYGRLASESLWGVRDVRGELF